MNEFKLLTVDVLISINDHCDLLSSVKRGMVGLYDHVFLYLGETTILVDGVIIRHPMLFESMGRGCCLRSLSNRYGEKVVVMRLKSQFYKTKIPQILEEAVKLASDPQAFYDYMCIVKWVLPRLILERLGLPIPLPWQRDARQICSEAIWEIFYRAKLFVLPLGRVPMPGDFVTDSPLLEKVWTGKLSEELV